MKLLISGHSNLITNDRRILLEVERINERGKAQFYLYVIRLGIGKT